MQEVSSDTLPRDEVTGLAAFDDLDPISTVSTLNIMPDPPAAMPRVFAPPPRPAGSVAVPPPGYAARSGGTLPPPDFSARSGATLPPPGLAARTFSRPPEVTPLAAPPTAARAADDTEIVDLPDDAQEAQESYESYDSDDAQQQAAGSDYGWEDDAATRVQAPMLHGSGAAPAAELQMDWDDEELPTQMRGEAGVQMIGEDLSTAAFEPVSTSFPSGRPSPFPSAHTQEALAYAPVGSVPPPAALPSMRQGVPSPFVRAPEQDTAWGQDLRSERPQWLWIALGAVAIIGLGIAGRGWLSAPAPGLVTLTTVPADARVLVDGKPVPASSSPFSATDLAPGVTHELLVQKDGYVEQRTPFTLAAGEAKSLPEIKLVAHESGFAIDSTPAGADVLVDGQSVGQVTPARVTHVAPGLHKLQLTHNGYQTYELQAFVTDNAVLELPAVQLAAASAQSGKTAKTPAPAEPATAAPVAAEVSAATEHHHHHHHAAATEPAHFNARPATVATPKVAAAPRVAAPAPVASSGSKGTLRVNSRPWSQVFVDGKLLGNTPQMAIQLSPGNHSVKLVNQPMGLTKTFSVGMKAGQTVTKVLNLIE